MLVATSAALAYDFQHTPACPNPSKQAYGYGCTCTAASCGNFMLPVPKNGSALVVKSMFENYYFMAERHPVRSVRLSGTTKSDAEMQIGAGAVRGRFPLDGFGSAFTDAMAYNFERLDNLTKAAFIEAHFGKYGLGYTMGRVHMGASDFSRMDYTLLNLTDDLALSSFCLRDDSASEVPCGSDYKTVPILAAQAALQEASQPELRLYVSSWSPPLWMKDQRMSCMPADGLARCHANASAAPLVECAATVTSPCDANPIGERCPQSDGSVFNDPEYVGPGLHHDTVEWAEGMLRHNADGNCYYTGMLSSNASVQQAYADLYVRFIDAYAAKGIPMWGMTVQNEPLTQTGLWNGLFFTPELQASFVKRALGPAIRKAHPHLKIMIHDDATNELSQFAKAVLDDLEARQYVDGVGYHWYTHFEGLYEDDEGGPALGPVSEWLNIPTIGGGAQVRTLGEQYPEQFFMMTEACNGFALGTSMVGPRPGEWGYGYAYSHDIMWQLKNGASGWVEWNMALDLEGGPNHNGNQVDAPTLVVDESTLLMNPSFFHMAHFSRFLPRGSRLLEQTVLSCTLHSARYCDNVVAFVTPPNATSTPNSLVFVLTNDEVSAVPNYAGGAGVLIYDDLAKGQGSLNPGVLKSKDVQYTVGCDGVGWVSGVLEWKAIHTVIIPCGEAPCRCA